MTKIVVFDIDGTLANIEHRRAFVATKPKNWKAFNAGIVNDTRYEDMVWLVNHFDNALCKIILCSGRGEEHRDVTEKQMNDFFVPYNALYMRPAKDHRPDYVIKVELLQQIRADFGEPFLWFDDRNQVVDAIRAEGVRVLQVAPGDF
jgi:phosphoglycolate phosphatase-like HAD superfamily hydrolase